MHLRVRQLHEPHIRGLRLRAAIGEGLHRPRELRGRLVRESHDPRQSQHGQRHGEFRNQFGLTTTAEGIDQIVGQILTGAPQFERVDRLERGLDHVEVPPVFRAGGEVDRGHGPADHRQQRPVRRNVRPLIPQGHIARKQIRVAGHLVQLAVADHQPGRDPTGQFHRHHRTVVAAHLVVEVMRVGMEPRTAQRHHHGILVHRAGSGVIEVRLGAAHLADS